MADPETIVIVALSLVLAASGYAYLVRKLRRRNPDHGQTAWLVVVGVAMVVVGYAFVAGIEHAAIVAGLFAAAGIPMIVEYVDDHTDLISRRRMADRIRGDE